MDCLVTGGAGFIGSHLVDALLERGDTVAVIDNLSHGRRENLETPLEQGAELHVADVRNADEVETVFRRVQPEVVFHLAAQIDTRASVQAPVTATQWKSVKKESTTATWVVLTRETPTVVSS